MKRMPLRWCALLLLSAAAWAETRPHYGGTLRVEVRDAMEMPDPPQSEFRLGELNTGFAITLWEAGRRAGCAARESAPGGRPFLDSVEVQLGRTPREQALDLELGKADIVELAPAEIRRITSPRR